MSIPSLGLPLVPALAVSAFLTILLLFVVARALVRGRRRRAAEREKQRMAEETALRHAKAIEENRKAIATTRSPAAISARFEVIRDHAEKLSALAEHYDLPDIPASTTPSDAKAFYRSQKDAILRERTLEQVEAALARAATIPKVAGKITFLERALILCLEAKRTAKDEALAREFGIKADQIQGMIGGLMTPRPNPPAV